MLRLAQLGEVKVQHCSKVISIATCLTGRKRESEVVARQVANTIRRDYCFHLTVMALTTSEPGSRLIRVRRNCIMRTITR